MKSDDKSDYITSKTLDHDGSAKETLSLSTASQTPAYGDTGSASLGGWSVAHQNDSADVSKVNLLLNEDCNSGVSALACLGANYNHFQDEFCDRLEVLLSRLEKLVEISVG